MSGLIDDDVPARLLQRRDNGDCHAGIVGLVDPLIGEQVRVGKHPEALVPNGVFTEQRPPAARDQDRQVGVLDELRIRQLDIASERAA